jgi:hypothetical protein
MLYKLVDRQGDFFEYAAFGERLDKELLYSLLLLLLSLPTYLEELNTLLVNLITQPITQWSDNTSRLRP